MRLEDKVRSWYPDLLDATFLTTDSWVLDSGCGFGLISNQTKFVELRSDKGDMFTFADGSKHSSTHIGTVKLYFQGPQGIRPFLFENIALVPHAKSNILSEFWLKSEGYQIITLRLGKFQFVFYDNKLVFLPKAINGAYYLQNKNVNERQQFCNAVKLKPWKPLTITDNGRLEQTLQEWHVNRCAGAICAQYLTGTGQLILPPKCSRHVLGNALG
ncbi:Transposable element [Phytophthora megakarya]|uniref:Transposable element n=1 Tax=Phytophthora megakarya TaxID=4795 RepID=A0A225W0Y1_9STRA|nr:Transposable element [Phytophthora megakarya]